MPTRTLAEAQQQGFVVVYGYADDSVLAAYVRHCRQHKQPCIKVRARKKYASIELDMDTGRKELSGMGARVIGRILAAAVPAHKWGPFAVIASSSFCYSRWVPVGRAKEVAHRIVLALQRGDLVIDPAQLERAADRTV